MFKKRKYQNEFNRIVNRRLNSHTERLRLTEWGTRMAHDRIDNQHKRYERLERRIHELEREEVVAELTLEAYIATAIADERSLVFNYTKPEGGGTEVRAFSPYELIKVRNGLVVRGWDHIRDDIRSFRLDRMESPADGLFDYRRPEGA